VEVRSENTAMILLPDALNFPDRLIFATVINGNRTCRSELVVLNYIAIIFISVVEGYCNYPKVIFAIMS
jgi:hypothetical protein